MFLKIVSNKSITIQRFRQSNLREAGNQIKCKKPSQIKINEGLKNWIVNKNRQRIKKLDFE